MAIPLTITEPPAKLLERLAAIAELEAFDLAFYDREFQLLAINRPQAALCGNPGNPFCNPDCHARQAAKLAMIEATDQPGLIFCPGKLQHCLVSCQDLQGQPTYLLVGGGRETQINLPYLEELAGLKQTAAMPLLEHWNRLPHFNPEELLAAGRIAQQHLSLPESSYNAPCSNQVILKEALIRALVQANQILASATNPRSLRNAIEKLLEPAFGPRSVSLLIPGEPEPELHCLERWPSTSQQHSSPSLTEPIDDGPSLANNEQITCLPLIKDQEQLGSLLCFGPAPSLHEMQLLVMLAERIGSRLQQLGDSQVSSQAATFESKRFHELLSLTKPEDLCRQILEDVVKLIPVDKASMMLLNGSGSKLRLLASIGMNRSMAANLSVPANQGIAGQVLHNGQPLLVEDMEQDPRISSSPRPRFNTKSFLCVPLTTGSQHHGVLCLTDRRDGRPFNQQDMELLNGLAGPGAVLIERLRNQQQVSRLREQVALDPATGVYSASMFKRRFAEEACRSERLQQDLTLLLFSADGPEQKNQRPILDLAKRLKSLVRTMDVVGRLDSNLFAMLLPNTNSNLALTICNRLYGQSDEPQNVPLLPASCGIASFPDHGASYELLLQSATKALQKAVQQGGGRALSCGNSPRNDKIVFL